MARQWPDHMGTYKAMVLDAALQKAQKSGMPQFAVRLLLAEYYDAKENEWFDVSDNNYVLTAYLTLYGRKDSQEDGEIITTLNHQQVCKVFGWDGCGLAYLVGTDFSGRTVQVRIEENTYENAKTPVQVSWIDTEDADPNQGLQKLDEKAVKALEAEFSFMWAGKKTVTPAKATPKASKPPAVEPEKPPADDKTAKKAALLAKSKKLREAAKTTPPAPPAKKTKVVEQPPAETEATPVPEGYDKKRAWCDVVEMKNPDADDTQLNAAWDAAIAETAEGGDEDKLDAAGWWAVKELTLGDVGVL